MPKYSAPQSKQPTRQTVSPKRKASTKLAPNEIARPRKYGRRYTNKSYDEIAAALGLLVARVKQNAKSFEGAARWYWLDGRTPTRARPRDIEKRLERIRDTAGKLLAHLGIENPGEASDGPGIPEIMDALIGARENATEDIVAKTTEGIAWLLEYFEAICLTVELQAWAHQAAKDAVYIGDLTTSKGYQGDRALNYWVLWMLSIHRLLTNVDARLPLHRSQSAKFYRFLAAAGRPLGIDRSRSQWKEHVRTAISWPAD